MTVKTASQVRFVGDLSIDELSDLVHDLGRQVTDCREGIRQAGQAAEQALARRDMDSVARAVEQETELQQRLPNLNDRLTEA